MSNDYSALDEALVTLATAGPELRNGNSNHAPMAIEALCAMGRGDTALPWLDHYRKQLTPRPAQFERITDANWQAAIGDPRRLGDWFEFFTDALKQQPWRIVLNQWAPRLAPGVVAAAMHGVIRTGHAARAIALEDTPQRRRELADGLAYWAAEHTKLPGHRRPPADRLPSDAIESVPLLPLERRGRVTSLTGALVQLDSFQEFHGTLAAVDPARRDAAAFTSDLTATFARVYLTNAHDVLTTIAFIHTVTGPAALRAILPHLDEGAARLSLAYMWQASAALYATFGTEKPRLDGTALDIDTNELIERAIATGDEHAIKFTEVCLDEHAHNPRPEYFAAATHAVRMLDGK
jgi:hypothetical protein